jgi:hypothetical protein
MLDVQQIFGRAGRPQFEQEGLGIIITQHAQLAHYLGMLTHQAAIESQFTRGLEDNLNAEVVLGALRTLRTLSPRGPSSRQDMLSSGTLCDQPSCCYPSCKGSTPWLLQCRVQKVHAHTQQLLTTNKITPTIFLLHSLLDPLGAAAHVLSLQEVTNHSHACALHAQAR